MSREAAKVSTDVIDAARRAMVDRAREEWIRRLIDPSRNNNLLFFRHLKTGTLDLSRVPTAVADLLQGRRVRVRDLVPDSAAETAGPTTERRMRSVEREDPERDVR